jgi:protein translocase SEC61 complex gamma subunit
MMKLNPIPMVKKFYDDSKRMISVSYKPNAQEFKRTLKVVLFGTIILGIVGYLISIIVGLIV